LAATFWFDYQQANRNQDDCEEQQGQGYGDAKKPSLFIAFAGRDGIGWFAVPCSKLFITQRTESPERSRLLADWSYTSKLWWIAEGV
jgi:hypothetical protein